ncbi:integrase arm-type DNA-binding domain-containing protein [Aliivibrio fischeri]|uniref:integrase arm-type DNA-binding domain-containing protein n=1 Tax=Aliivibrio fischeri TaxID=668 RepID=UPI00080EE6DC|nr:integrase arm-type DNA-binding domain-containing protein [Aliivibrio fischeri]OCH48195.1 hypothetical protein A6E02_08690 [Aliivibrio fischeri]
MMETTLLTLSVKLSGKKVWLYTYKQPFTKKRTKITIGQYPAIPLAQDIDPNEHRDEQLRKRVEEAENTLKSVTKNGWK